MVNPITEPHIKINERTWVIPTVLQTIAVQNDEGSETVYIDIPRYFDGIDRSEYDICLYTVNEDGRTDDFVFQNSELEITEDLIIAAWKLEPPQTSYSGGLRAYIIIRGIDGYRWSTFSGKFIIGDLPDADPVVPATPSAYESWLEKISEISNSGKNGADWSVNDPNATGYVKNRTHWAEDPVLVTVLPEMTVTADPESLNAYFTPETPPVVNARYNVQLDDAAYSVTAVELMGMVCLGNTSLAGAENDTGEPFLLLYSPEEQVMIGIFTAAGEHTLSVFGEVRTYHIIDEAYLPPLIGKPGTAAGAEVFNDPLNTALGISSHAEGFTAAASGMAAHAEGDHTTASGDGSHAEGCETNASALYTHAEGYQTTASGVYSHAEGWGTAATTGYAHAEGDHTTASGDGSHAEGLGTIARASYQHAEGKYNAVDTTGVYAHIVGNGTSDARRSNAYVLDWSGNGFFSGYVQARNDFRLLSPNGTRYRLYVDDDGTLHTEMTL